MNKNYSTVGAETGPTPQDGIPDIKKMYTDAEVRNLLRIFAYRLNQREGQYLPTIQPCEDFIKEFNL